MARRGAKFHWTLVQFLRALVNWSSEIRMKCESRIFLRLAGEAFAVAVAFDVVVSLYVAIRNARRRRADRGRFQAGQGFAVAVAFDVAVSLYVVIPTEAAFWPTRDLLLLSLLMLQFASTLSS